jgi:hypothetical protein
MSEAARVILDAIEAHEKAIKDLKSALRKLGDDVPTSKRHRKQTGLQEGSLPYRVQQRLKETETPLSAADISDYLKSINKPADSRTIAAALNRYIEAGRIFERTADGMYALKKE